MRKHVALAAALLAAPTLASADRPNLYWGAALGDFTADQREVGLGTENTTDFGLRLGYHFFDFVGIEVRVGRDTGGVAGDTDADTTYAGVFARFDLPFEKANVYLLAGASELRFDDEAVDEDVYDEVAGGVGVELYGSERTAVTLEYMSYSDDAYSGLSIGFKRHFGLPPFR